MKNIIELIQWATFLYLALLETAEIILYFFWKKSIDSSAFMALILYTSFSAGSRFSEKCLSCFCCFTFLRNYFSTYPLLLHRRRILKLGCSIVFKQTSFNNSEPFRVRFSLCLFAIIFSEALISTSSLLSLLRSRVCSRDCMSF